MEKPITTIYIVLILMACHFTTNAQISNIKYEVEAQALGTTNDVVPFWMRSNQYGSIPVAGLSSSFIGRAHKEYIENNFKSNAQLLDWGFGLDGRTNLGRNSNIRLIEAYVKGRLGIFQIKAGRSKDVMGINGDTALTSGNFAISGNALGIPKIELSISEYYRLPIIDGLFSVKGNFAHGWIGRTAIIDKISDGNGKLDIQIYDIHPKTYLHQKSLYIKLAKQDWKLNLYGGFNHQVFWGGEQQMLGENFKLSPAETFFYVVTGKAYGTAIIERSKIGNQLGSIDFAAEYDFNKIKVMIYRQNIYDVGALSKLANIKDGINGLSIQNKTFGTKDQIFKWKKLLAEFFYSKDQAGYPWSTPTASGDEDYYNNYYYFNGWSYKNRNLGTPLITSVQDAKNGQADNGDYFINNRVSAIHLGFEGAFKDISVIAKGTYSKNYGTFGNSIYGKSTGDKRYPNNGEIFVPVKQMSFYIGGMKEFSNGVSAGATFAFDSGRLLNNSNGLMLRVIKSFN